MRFDDTMKVGFTILIFFTLPIFSFGQSGDSDVINYFEQISGLKINDIKRDSTGFLWVGTNDGLYRYDGYNFKLYEPALKALGSSIINTIFISGNHDIWVGTRGGLLKYDHITDQIISFVHDAQDAKTIGNNIVNAIVEDNDHDLWIAFSKGGLDLYKRNENRFYHFTQGDGSGLSADDLSDVHIDRKNQLWISSWHFGLNKLDLNEPSSKIPGRIKFKDYPSQAYFGKPITINFIYEDELRSELYVGTNGDGFWRYDENTDNFTSLNLSLNREQLNSATPFAPNKIFLCTDRDIRVVDLEHKTLEPVAAPLDVIRQPKIMLINEDNVTWIGTPTGLVRSVKRKIRHHRLDDTKKAAPMNNVTALLKQGQYLWIGTWAGGLHLKDEASGKIIRVNPDSELLEATWSMKLINDGKILLLATHRGIAKLDVSDMSLRANFRQTDLYRGYFHFTCLSDNEKGTTWVGSWDGSLYTVDYTSGEVSKFDGFPTKSHLPPFLNHLVQAVLLDHKNRLWLGTRFSGLIRLDNIDGVVQPRYYSERLSPPNYISNDGVVSLLEDSTGRIWAGTEGGGINVIDPDRDTTQWIMKGEHQLASNNIKALTTDKSGTIWVSSQRGISRFDPKNGFTNYTKEDGLDYMNFNYNAVTQSDSMLYFGNESGYNVFNPTSLQVTADPKVFITDFKINNRPFQPGITKELESDVTGSLHSINSVTLSHEASNLSFEFSSLDFTAAPREIYAYKLEGVSDSWTVTNASNRRVNYTNLSPGKYTFRVKVIRDNSDPQDQGRSMEIIIVPPFWQTLWFKASAVLACIGLLYSAHRIRLERINKQKIKFEKLADERIKVIEKKNIEIQTQTARLHEADKSKLEFFTNLSHEFRTPLMLIIGPIEALLDERPDANEEKLTMVQRNAQRLLRLMDQIMDITKLDTGNLAVNREEGDIVAYIKEIVKSFQYLADTKKIQFEWKSSLSGYRCTFDHDKVEKVFYNLLSNAFKATPQNGVISVCLELRDAGLWIEMANSGVGIRKEDLPNLFTRFYRTKNYSDGTGLGLSLTKSLVELLGGSIEVKSEENVNTTFYIYLPVEGQFAVTDLNTPLKSEEARLLSVSSFGDKENTTFKRSSVPDASTVLIVEDDDDMRQYISELLEPSYSVIRALHAEEAVKFAYEFQPDLIISDMMMPGMDGYEFMRTIKKDPNVSHIPIILLTGKATVEARLQGIEEGADDYITKPFHEKILLARVKNLIEQRRMMRERFSTDLELKPKEMTITSVDEKFMENLIDLVEKNLSDPAFNSEIICRELGIGRSYLYSKIKAITDLSVNEFIKTVRLKKAAILLRTTNQNVNEVSTAVGFNDRSHFSKSFTKQFGVAPAQFQKQKEV